MVEAKTKKSTAKKGKGCVHKWRIESPSGSSSKGVCRVCGETGEFKNSIEYSNWTSRGRMGKRAGTSGK